MANVEYQDFGWQRGGEQRVAQGMQRSVRMPRISPSWFLGMLFVLIAYKAYLFGVLGPTVYEERVARLAGGTAIEQMGAFVMQADPLTSWIAERVGHVR